MKLDLLRHPFSFPGSYLVLSEFTTRDLGDHRWEELRQPDGLYLRHVHGDGRKVIARLDLIAGGEIVPARWAATPTELTGRSSGGARVRITFDSPTDLRFEGRRGAALRITVVEPGIFALACPAHDGRWIVNHFVSGTRFEVGSERGHVDVRAPWDGWRCPEIVFEFSASPRSGTWAARWSEIVEQPLWMEEKLQARDLPCFSSWLASVPELPGSWERGRELAAYVLWVSIAGPRGLLRRPGVLMSKNWMPQIWSWDHCFNAMALSLFEPRLAWDNFMLVFDHQSASGKLPDTVTDTTLGWHYTKAPIHGWALRWMLEHSQAVGKAQMEEALPPLEAWTLWWFAHRRDPATGLPHYHHGNDGWDNATAFKAGLPLASPELPAYLILQMDAIGTLHAMLGRKREAAKWRAESDALLGRWIGQLWDGERFHARQTTTGREHPSDSLLLLMPLVLGRRLPAPIRRKLLDHLLRPGGHLTPWGVATEALSSDQYEADGYWRGPIWAPCMVLLAWGLRDAGEHRIAGLLASRFRRLFLRSGAAENYHAETGAALRDPCYSWSASAYLILAEDSSGRPKRRVPSLNR